MLTKVKDMLAKAKGAVTGLVKKRGSADAGAKAKTAATAMANKEVDSSPSGNAQKMKAAVDAARNGKDGD